MSEQATEVAYLSIVPGTDLSTGDNKDIWEATLGTITSQPGCKSLFWGRQVEHPDVVQLVIDWESFESHKQFMASTDYKPFLERVKPLLTGPPKLFHVKLPPQMPFSQPGSAPATECLSIYFEPDHSTSEYDDNFAKFIEAVGKVPNETQGLTGGWGIEEQKHEKLGKEGEEGPAKLFGAFIGWPSVESHMKFREHEKFPEVVKYLRDGAKAIAVHHVHFRKF